MATLPPSRIEEVTCSSPSSSLSYSSRTEDTQSLSGVTTAAAVKPVADNDGNWSHWNRSSLPQNNDSSFPNNFDLGDFVSASEELPPRGEPLLSSSTAVRMQSKKRNSFSHDLHNFTLVNLSNQNEDVEGMRMIEMEEGAGVSASSGIASLEIENSQTPPALFEDGVSSSPDRLLDVRDDSSSILPRLEFNDDDEDDVRPISTYREMYHRHRQINQDRMRSSGVGVHHKKMQVVPSLSSSTSSDDNSDTGFLVHKNKTRTRDGEVGCFDKHAMPHCPSQNMNFSSMSNYNGNGSDNVVLMPKKRLTRRKRTMGHRKLNNFDRGHHGNVAGSGSGSSNLFPICCCCDGDGEEDTNPRLGTCHSQTAKHFRLCCKLVVIIFIVTFLSILVSLQKKVDLLSLEVTRLSSTAVPAAVGNNDSNLNQALKDSPVVTNLIASHDALNTTLTSIIGMIEEQRLAILENSQFKPSLDQITKNLATLGSEMKGSMDEMKNKVGELKSKITDIENRINENRVAESNPAPPVPNTTVQTNVEDLSSAPFPPSVDEPNNDGLKSKKLD